jgi:hypothetical protein
MRESQYVSTQENPFQLSSDLAQFVESQRERRAD